MKARPRHAPRGMRGFSLIEVLIAILVLSFGLLGLAMLQTMSVRFAESANYRTQTTNLAYELLDQIRVNRVNLASYEGTYRATAGGDDCAPATGANLTTARYMAAWRCRLGRTLGDDATANVAIGADDEVTVTINWGDERWNADSGTQSLEATTRL
ncbi:type IV pilus modification protein PilV [Luteimonas aquatica]|uniref:type IV pilus modification protein PilV n=1 Tax=Luteimonas aquatica TaxID=450364 RepID=UPI001F55BB60|nr:type IV pilus modification protein PilV [Luteimonas aquatica]